MTLPAMGSSTSYFQTRFLTGEESVPVTSAWKDGFPNDRDEGADEDRDATEEDEDEDEDEEEEEEEERAVREREE